MQVFGPIPSIIAGCTAQPTTTLPQSSRSTYKKSTHKTKLLEDLFVMKYYKRQIENPVMLMEIYFLMHNLK